MTRSLAGAIQASLASLYALDELPPVDDFVRIAAPGAREEVVVREGEDDVEVAVVLPEEALRPSGGEVELDVLCQIVEGVSHFVVLAERIRTELPTTELELELQAEIDKFMLLSAASPAPLELHARLYERVSYVHAEDSERGHRYRTANRLAARACARLCPCRARRAPWLRRFFRAGQEEKIRMALAA
ncbi:MAG: hypothetical protein IT374_21290 [Polyangiaceae bacterium]|nr:hypothetical protein [Polyangiaceae bacterium]